MFEISFFLLLLFFYPNLKVRHKSSLSFFEFNRKESLPQIKSATLPGINHKIFPLSN